MSYRFLSRLNWKHAVGEVTLIVVGVLVALAVNSWWEHRKDAATERDYLRQLIRDAQENDKEINVAVSRQTAVMDTATKLSVAFDAPGALPSCETLFNLVTGALNVERLRLRTGAYSALLTTGEINLIQSDTLRAEIIQYAGIVDDVRSQLNQSAAEAWDAAEPFRRRIDFGWRMFQPRSPTDPPPWSGCNLEPLRHDAEIRKALFSTQLLNTNRIGSLKDLGTANTALLSHLRELQAGRF